MKDWKEIPECVEIIEEMFKKWEEIPRNTNAMKDLEHERRRRAIEHKYLKKLKETYNNYINTHKEK